MKRYSTILSVLAVLALAVAAVAGPIKGLVDVGTGQEVPDADARYVLSGGSFTNDVGWYTNLYVLMDASNSTQVVNWQTMTNYIANLPSTNVISVASVNYDASWAPTSSNAFDFGSALFPVRTGYFHTVVVDTNSLIIGDVPLSSDGTDIFWDGNALATESYSDSVSTNQQAVAFSASATQDWIHASLEYNTFDVTRGRIWVANTNNDPFDATVTLTWYVDSDRHGEDALYRADIDLVQVLANGAATAPTNTITVDDASSFSVNDLVVIYDSDSTEYARIAAINSNDLTFEDNLSSNVDDDAGVSRVGEYGGFSLWGTNKTVWARATFSSGQTVDLSNWLEYKK